MDGIANVAKQQQTQVSAQEMQNKETVKVQQTQQAQSQDLVKQAQERSMENPNKLDSKKDVEDLVKKLNDALSPISTSIKFGVDQNDVFYVSVIEAKTNKVIRRFPAEKAQQVLPKMQEVNGILFDHKG